MRFHIIIAIVIAVVIVIVAYTHRTLGVDNWFELFAIS